MATAAEILASIASKESDIEAERQEHIVPLEEALMTLRDTLNLQQTECVHASVSLVDTSEIEGLMRFRCENADCAKEWDCRG